MSNLYWVFTMIKTTVAALCFLTLFSCDLEVTDLSSGDPNVGGTSPVEASKIGDERKAAESITGSARDTGLSVCRSLEDFRIRASSGDKIRYKLTRRNCNESRQDLGTRTGTIVDRLGQSLEIRGDSANLFFEDILTDSHQLLNEVCRKLNRGEVTTNTYQYSNGLYYQVKFMANTSGRWLQVYDFDRSDRIYAIHTANIATADFNARYLGQTLYRDKVLGCSGSDRIRANIQEFAP